MDNNIYVYINGAKTSLISLAASSGVSYATLLARYKAGVSPAELVPKTGQGITAENIEAALGYVPAQAQHAEAHGTGGADPITPSSIGAVPVASGATAGHAAIMTAAGGVADAGYIPYRKVLLWENASPSSSFPPQDISVDLSGYDRYGIDFGDATTNTRSVYAETITASVLYACISNGATNNMASRTVTPSSTYISVSNAYSGGSGSPDNTRLIPLRIYGIKGVG